MYAFNQVVERGENSKKRMHRRKMLHAPFHVAFSSYLGACYKSRVFRILLIVPKENQHGFHKSHACLTSLLEFLESVNKHTGKGDQVDIMHLTLSKSFKLFTEISPAVME